jgi:ketosteroid isomerase-like protein
MTADTTALPGLRDPAAAAANAALLVEGYAAFARGDMPTLERVFAPSVTWHVRRLGRLSGDHAGWPAVLAFFAGTAQISEGTFRVEILEVLGGDAGAAAVVRSTAKRGDRALDDRQIHQFHIRDGRVVEVWQYPGDVETADRFWG